MNAAIQKQCSNVQQKDLTPQQLLPSITQVPENTLSIKKLRFTVHLSHETSLITLQRPAYSTTEACLHLTHYPIQPSRDLQSPA